MTGRYRDILVVDLLGGFGDLLMLLPAVHGLARRNPGATVRVLTHAPGADLVRSDPAVHEVRVARPGRPGAARTAVVEALADRTPDLAVTTTRYDGIPDLLAGSGARCVTDLWRHPPPDEPVGARYLRILREEGLLTDEDLTRPVRVRLRPAEAAAGDAAVSSRLPAAPARPPVVLVPEAGMAVKRWPGRHWRALAETLIARGHPLLAVTPVTGTPAVPLPTGDLRRLAGCYWAVAGRGGVVVGGDTGPVRLAAATGARTVGLFGPTPAARYGVAAGTDLQGLPDCPHRRPTSITEQPCWWTAACPLSPVEPACMAELTPDRVGAAVARLTADG